MGGTELVRVGKAEEMGGTSRKGENERGEKGEETDVPRP